MTRTPANEPLSLVPGTRSVNPSKRFPCFHFLESGHRWFRCPGAVTHGMASRDRFTGLAGGTQDLRPGVSLWKVLGVVAPSAVQGCHRVTLCPA